MVGLFGCGVLWAVVGRFDCVLIVPVSVGMDGPACRARALRHALVLLLTVLCVVLVPGLPP